MPLFNHNELAIPTVVVLSNSGNSSNNLLLSLFIVASSLALYPNASNSSCLESPPAPLVSMESAIEALNGESSRLKDLSVAISANIISDVEGVDYATAFEKVNAVINDHSAYQKFLDMIKAQGGDIKNIAVAKYVTEIKADCDGFVQKIETEKLGNFVCDLGGGRRKKEDGIDYSVGIKNRVAVADEIKEGEVLCEVHSNRELTEEEKATVRSLFTLVPYSLDKPRLIYAKINSVGEIILY